MNTTTPPPIETRFTQLLHCKYPIIAGPMFLVSDEDLVCEVSNAGGIGGTPSLNWRKPEQFQEAIQKIKARASGNPYAVNLIVNKANPRQGPDLEICVQEKVPMVITSLGNPKEVIQKMHQVGGKVFCDVTTLEHAKKVEGLGADGVIAVSAGAGGHAGPISPMVFIPYLKKNLKIPIVAAGGIVNGQQMAAAILLGASAVQIGTRYIASQEAKVSKEYKEAILKAHPEDIILTKKVSGTPCSVIKTPYIEKMGTELNFIENYLHKSPHTKKYMKMLRAYVGSKLLEKAVGMPTWKEVWSAGQGSGLINEILPAQEITYRLAQEFKDSLQSI